MQPHYQHNSETLKTVLNLPPNTPMEYKCHDDSIRDNSSFRNTDIYR
jgi:translation initiation factor 4E